VISLAKVKVAKVGDIAEGDLKKVDVAGEPVALFNVEGKFYATSNICTHEHCELDENHMMHGDVVECTCHGSQFNIKIGVNVLPPAAEPLKTYQVSVENDEIFVEN